MVRPCWFFAMVWVVILRVQHCNHYYHHLQCSTFNLERGTTINGLEAVGREQHLLGGGRVARKKLLIKICGFR